MRALLTLIAATLLLGACAKTGRAAHPQPGGHDVAPPAASASAPAPRPGPAATAAVELAISLVGTPYRPGGASPAGFDCSGFVQYVFARSGIGLPRDVGGLLNAGRPIETDALLPGDLVFFAIDGQAVSHVGIYEGPDAFVHAPSTNGRVRAERLSMEYWQRRYAGARRIVEGEERQH